MLDLMSLLQTVNIQHQPLPVSQVCTSSPQSSEEAIMLLGTDMPVEKPTV